MKVALIGDVHANLPALEAVLADADARGVEEVWNVGDFVGYGAEPEQVVQLLRERARASILGNYDRKVLLYPRKKAQWLKTKNAEKLRAFQWAWEHLSKASRNYLTSLPAQQAVGVAGRSVLLVHGSPESEDEPLTDETPEDRLRELAARADAEVVVCGHSHRPMAREVGGVLFVGTGSVGRPEGGDRRACYAILDIESDRLDVEHHRVAYDVSKAVAAIRQSEQPEAFAQMVLTGQGYQEVQDQSQRREQLLAPARALAEQCGNTDGHAEQVSRLAVGLFDQLAEQHGLGGPERLLLECAGLLHDIGWCEGRQRHHKRALRLILADATLPLDERERRIVANVARYHRKAPPASGHKDYEALSRDDRRVVRLLSGMLRIVDGLDCTHHSLVQAVTCRVEPKRLEVVCLAAGEVPEELAAAEKKSDVLAKVLRRAVALRVQRADA